MPIDDSARPLLKRIPTGVPGLDTVLRGVALFEATDQRIPGAGGVALWTKADSVTEFVDLLIDPLP